MAKKQKKPKKQKPQKQHGFEKQKKDEKKDKRPMQQAKLARDLKQYPKDLRFIVRISNKDLDGRLPIERALLGLKGINYRMGRIISLIFEEKTSIGFNKLIGEIPEDKDKLLEDIVLNPGKFGVPDWNLNKRKDYDSGENLHLTMGELDFGLRNDLQRLGKIKSYRGLRHTWGLTVRGQRTRSSFRGKGGAIGVTKKDAKAKAAPKKVSTPPKGAKPVGKKK